MNRRILRSTALVCLLFTALAIAGPGSGSAGPRARSSASVKKQVKSVKKQLKKLKKQLTALKKQVAAFSAQPGPQGPQGPQGTQGSQGAQGVAPACQGNNASDKMVKVGSVCIDRYEASVWSSPTGGSQYGASSDNYPCDDNGQDCKGKIYARSVAGVKPSAYITWFQAQQALANSGKRLPTNAEWQMAVAGTPDSTACNVNLDMAANTGSRPSCVSSHGANDMVGNAWEWVADWVPRSTICGSWPSGYGADDQCLAGAATDGAPGALMRGGNYDSSDAPDAGPFAVHGDTDLTGSSGSFGFRGAR